MSTTCIGCGREIPAERASLGYTYCTAPDCQAQYRRGPTVTAVAVNKSGDAYRLAVPDEGSVGAPERVAPASVPAPRRPAARRPARRARPSWTPAQEKIVRLYADMGLSPRQIAERARQNTPRLNVTENLVVRILSAPRSAAELAHRRGPRR
jgi:hypothetical protein